MFRSTLPASLLAQLMKKRPGEGSHLPKVTQETVAAADGFCHAPPSPPALAAPIRISACGGARIPPPPSVRHRICLGVSPARRALSRESGRSQRPTPAATSRQRLRPPQPVRGSRGGQRRSGRTSAPPASLALCAPASTSASSPK